MSSSDFPYISPEQWEAVGVMAGTFGQDRIHEMLRTFPQEKQILHVNQFMENIRRTREQSAKEAHENAQLQVQERLSQLQQREEALSLRERQCMYDRQVENDDLRAQVQALVAHLSAQAQQPVPQPIINIPESLMGNSNSGNNPRKYKIPVSNYDGKSGRALLEWILDCNKGIRALGLTKNDEQVDFAMAHL